MRVWAIAVSAITIQMKELARFQLQILLIQKRNVRKDKNFQQLY
jgi:hypothetical protein